MLAHLLLSGLLHVTSALIHNVASLLARLLDLLEGTALLLLEQADTVGEQAQVVLGTLSCDLGGDQLLVQCGIVVFFIRREVHFSVLTAHILQTFLVLHGRRAVRHGLLIYLRLLRLHLFK